MKLESVVFRAAQRLPRGAAVWQIAEDAAGTVIVDADSEEVLAFRESDTFLTNAALFGVIRAAMVTPAGGRAPMRPRTIQIGDAELEALLARPLRAIGVAVELLTAVEVAELALDRLLGGEVKELPAGTEVTVTDEAPSWLRGKIAALLPRSVASTAAGGDAPLVFIWAPAAEVEALAAQLAPLTVLSLGPDLEEPARFAEPGDTSIWLEGPTASQRLVGASTRETRAPLVRAMDAGRPALIIVAERDTERPPPSYTRLVAAWPAEIVVVIEDDESDSEVDDSDVDGT